MILYSNQKFSRQFFLTEGKSIRVNNSSLSDPSLDILDSDEICVFNCLLNILKYIPIMYSRKFANLIAMLHPVNLPYLSLMF